MATSNEYKNFILEQLRSLDFIECKSMMGEYLLYYKGTLFGGIYDNRLLVKKTAENIRFAMAEEIPYEGAKAMFMVEDLENKELLEEIVLATYDDLKRGKK